MIIITVRGFVVSALVGGCALGGPEKGNYFDIPEVCYQVYYRRFKKDDRQAQLRSRLTLLGDITGLGQHYPP